MAKFHMISRIARCRRGSDGSASIGGLAAHGADMPFTGRPPTGERRPDRELARRFAAGEAGAIRELYARYGGPVHTVVASRLADRDLAEEAVQDVFLKAWRAAARFDPDRDLAPWLYEIARRAAADSLRRERRRPATTTLPSTAPADEVTTFGDTWEIWQVRRALGELPDDERELVRLTHYVGLTQAQIAELLDIPIGTVKSRLRRAHRRLAERLAHLRT